MEIRITDDANGTESSVKDVSAITWEDAIVLFFRCLRGMGFVLDFNDDDALGYLNDLIENSKEYQAREFIEEHPGFLEEKKEDTP